MSASSPPESPGDSPPGDAGGEPPLDDAPSPDPEGRPPEGSPWLRDPELRASAPAAPPAPGPLDGPLDLGLGELHRRAWRLVSTRAAAWTGGAFAVLSTIAATIAMSIAVPFGAAPIVAWSATIAAAVVALVIVQCAFAGFIGFGLISARHPDARDQPAFELPGVTFVAALAAGLVTNMLAGVAALALLVPGLALWTALSLTQWFVIDARLGPFAAMGASFDATRGRRLPLLLLGLVTFVYQVLTVVSCGLGGLVFLPLGMFLWTAVYEQLRRRVRAPEGWAAAAAARGASSSAIARERSIPVEAEVAPGPADRASSSRVPADDLHAPAPPAPVAGGSCACCAEALGDPDATLTCATCGARQHGACDEHRCLAAGCDAGGDPSWAVELRDGGWLHAPARPVGPLLVAALVVATLCAGTLSDVGMIEGVQRALRQALPELDPAAAWSATGALVLVPWAVMLGALLVWHRDHRTVLVDPLGVRLDPGPRWPGERLAWRDLAGFRVESDGVRLFRKGRLAALRSPLLAIDEVSRHRLVVALDAHRVPPIDA